MSSLTEQSGNKTAEKAVGSVHCDDGDVEHDFTIVAQPAPIDGVDRTSYIARDEEGALVARIGVGHPFHGRTRVGLDVYRDEARDPGFLQEATGMALHHSGVEVAWFNPDTGSIPPEVLDQAAQGQEDSGNYLFVAA
jgi:hypothetical protein